MGLGDVCNFILFNGLPTRMRAVQLLSEQRERQRVEHAYFNIKFGEVRVYFSKTRVDDCWKDFCFRQV